MATKKVTAKKSSPKKKVPKERKPLTLHKHYLVDIRRYAKDLGITEKSWGEVLDTRIISRNGDKYLALRVARPEHLIAPEEEGA